MIVRFVAAALMVAPGIARAGDPFYGVWQGNAVEVGSPAPYPMVLSIFERGGRTFQHTEYGAPLNCAGGGVVIERAAGSLHLSELIVRNREMCADGAVRVYLTGETDLIWEWFYPNGEFGARADLKKTP